MGEVIVQLPSPLYQQLIGRATDEKREPADAIVEAVEHWLRQEDEQPSGEERFRRALECTGLWVPPEERQYVIREPVDEQTREHDRQRVRQIMSKLETPLSEDIIADRR